MRKLILVGIAALMVLIAPPAVLAQSGLGPSDPLPNALARRSLAREWTSWFTALDRQIPTLSPSQEAWLKAEYHDEIAAAGNRFTARAGSAMESLEYQIFLVKPRTAEFVKVLTLIADANVRDKNQEVALWTLVSTWLIDYEYWQAVDELVERGTVQKQIGHVESLYFANYTLQAKDVLSKIVIPHLEGQLP